MRFFYTNIKNLPFVDGHKVMTGAGPLSIREAGRRLGRDVKAVHGDVQALLKAGILQKTDNGRIHFPFDAIHVDFMLKAA